MESYSHDEEQEGLMFQSYECPYYVQSPSTVSHENSTDIRNPATEDQSALTLHSHSPTPSESKNPDVSRFTLSRYSSSRGSNNSFLHHKSIVAHKGAFNRLIIVDNQNDDDEDGDEGSKGWWWRYCSFRSSNSCALDFFANLLEDCLELRGCIARLLHCYQPTASSDFYQVLQELLLFVLNDKTKGKETPITRHDGILGGEDTNFVFGSNNI
ncbi:hypothetical protein V6N13_097813 [Hibiscus sabdariffa]